MSRILVQFTDQENTVLLEDNKIKNYIGNGNIKISNSATEYEIWNLTAKFSSDKKTELPTDAYEIGELRPGANFKKTYKLLGSSSPAISIHEDIDLHHVKDSPNFERHTLIGGENCPVLFRLTLKNNSDRMATNITVIKTLPRICVEAPSFPPLIAKKVSVEKNKVIWQITDLTPGEERQLDIHTVCHLASANEDVTFGIVEVEYSIEDYNSIRVKPELEFETLTSSKIKPLEEKPGLWVVNLTFSANDEIPVDLDRFAVLSSGKVIYEKTNGGRVDSSPWKDEFEFNSDMLPSLRKKIEYSPEWSIKRNLNGKILKEAWVLPILAIETSKALQPNQMLSYDRRDITAITSVRNVGTGIVKRVLLEEQVPAYLYLKNVSKLRGLDLKTEEAKSPTVSEDAIEKPSFLEYDEKVKEEELQEEGEKKKKIEEGIETFSVGDSDDRLFVKTPKIRNETREREILVNEKLMLTEIRFAKTSAGLGPGERLDYEYVLHASKPLPDKDYSVSLRARSWPDPATKLGTRAETLAALDVKFGKRSYDVQTEEKPGKAEGERVVSITLENTGEVRLENVNVLHEVPRGFKVVEILPKAVSSDLSDNQLQWSIPALLKGRTIELSYKMKGRPGATVRLEEPDVIIRG